MIFGIKIITENRELLFRLRKISLSSEKILEKFLRIDGRIRNTTKVVLALKKTLGMIKEKDKTP